VSRRDRCSLSPVPPARAFDRSINRMVLAPELIRVFFFFFLFFFLFLFFSGVFCRPPVLHAMRGIHKYESGRIKKKQRPNQRFACDYGFEVRSGFLPSIVLTNTTSKTFASTGLHFTASVVARKTPPVLRKVDVPNQS